MRSAVICQALSACAALAAPAAAQYPFEDDFESYSPGPWPCSGAGCTGANGWGLWHYAYGNGPQDATITTVKAHTGDRSVRLRPYSDVIRTGNATSGRWRITIQCFFPAGLTAPSDSGYFVLLNECNTAPPVSFSLLLLLEGQSGRVQNNLMASAGSAALARNRWAEIKVEIDLDHNRHSVWYDGHLLYEDRTYAASGRRALECLALYSDGIDGLLFDTVLVEQIGAEPPPPGPTCYANCDGSTAAPLLTPADFDCFLQRFIAGDTYANCDGSTTTPSLDVRDFTCFIQRYREGCGN